MNVLTVFVSSKMRELHAERERLHKQLPTLDLGGYQLRAWVFESPDGAPASSSSIRNVYLDALQRSALYIGIIGSEYGEWTIDEFNCATRWGIDRHVYVKGTPDQPRDPKLKVFLDRWNDVETGVTLKFFGTLDDLTQAVTHALQAWTIEQVQARPPSLSAQRIETPEQVPDRASKLFGRQELVERLVSGLNPGAPTLVCGFAGTGKTAVAAAVCETWLARKSSNVLWLRCGFARVEDLVRAIARALSGDIAPHTLNRTEHLQLLAACLKKTPGALLVLDDCWNGEALFAVVSAISRETTMLVTARQRYPLEHIHEIDELPAHAALELLSNSAGRVLAPDEGASELCQALSHHAFSLEIAGRALKVQRRTCRELFAQIAISPDTLTAPLGFGERSRSSVKSLLNVSLDALTADQQLAFLAFGAFFAPTLTSEMLHQFLNDRVIWGDQRLTLPAVAHGKRSLDDTAGLLRALEEHSLVRRVFAVESPLIHISTRLPPGRDALETTQSNAPPIEVYRVHDLAYSFARSKASDDQRGHALDIVLAFAFFYNEPAQRVFDILRPELDNLTGAAIWAMTSGRSLYAERLADLLARSGRFLPSQGFQEHALRLLDSARRSAELRGDQDAVGRNVVEMANLMMQSGQHDEARAIYARELERARSAERDDLEQVLLANLGALSLRLGDYERAESLTQQALSIARRLKNAGLEADLLGNLGAIVAGAGRAEEAVTILEDASRRHEDSRNDRGLAIDLNHLGDLERAARNWNAAAGHYERALSLFERFAELPGIARTAHMIAISRLELGDTEAASRAVQKARETYASLGNNDMITACDRLIGLLGARDASAEFQRAGAMMEEGRYADAEAAYRRAVALDHGDAANNLGTLLLKQGRVVDALGAFERGAQLGSGTAAVNCGLVFERAQRFDDAQRAYERGVELGNGFAASCAGLMCYRQGRLADAERWFRTGVDLRDGSAAYNLAVLISEAGRSEEARDLYQQAMALGHGDAAANFGAVLYGEGQREQAMEVWRRGVDLGSGLAALNLGVYYFEQQQLAEAEKAWTRGVELRNAQAARYLGLILEQQERLEQAEAAFSAGAAGGDDESAQRLAALRAKQRNAGSDGSSS